MHRSIRASILAAAMPFVMPAIAAPVCHPVHHHRIAHIAKPVTHRTAGVGVTIDQARLVTFPEPVKTVYVGNPTIVDISMLDSQHAFLLGKTFGETNMIALGPDGKQISDQQVVVYNNGAAVTVNRGADQYDYMCTQAHCEASPRPGDPSAFVSSTEGSANSHEQNATAGGTSAPSQSASNQ